MGNSQVEGEYFAFDQEAGELRLVIKSRRPAYGYVPALITLAVIIGIGMTSYGLNELMRAWKGSSSSHLFFSISWLAMVGAFYGFLTAYFLTVRFGVEVVRIMDAEIVIERRVLFVATRSRYARGRCHSFRVLAPDAQYVDHPNIVYSRWAGRLGFTVSPEEKTVRCGASLTAEDAEAARVFIVKVMPGLGEVRT